MDERTVFMAVIDGAARPKSDEGDAIWWKAADGQSWRGYRAGGASLNGAWDALRPLTTLDGASLGEHAACHYVVETDIPAGAEADFNAWYETEHLPGLARVPGAIVARRYLRQSGSGPRYIACYDLVSSAAMQSPQWLAVRHTAWSGRVRPAFFNTRRTLYVRPDNP